MAFLIHTEKVFLVQRLNCDPRSGLSHFDIAGELAITAKTLAFTGTKRIHRAARAVRSAIRKTFAARKAAKAADSGGGSSDPDGRRPHTKPNTSKTSLTVSTFLSGGAK